MTVKLVVTAGPHTGREFAFDTHDTFLVGRSKDAHLQLTYDDPYFSRRHFLVEVNPPRVRVFDLNSRNGISVNGAKVRTADLKDGDDLRAGHTVFRVTVPRPADPDEQPTLGDHGVPAKPTKPTPPTQSPPTAMSLTPNPAEGGSVPGNRSVMPQPGAGPSIPGYRLEAELGRGAMGVVYRAVRQADGALVAVKVITPAIGVTQRQMEKFLREAQILGQLDHRNIVRHRDSGEGDGIVYLVMELMDGQDAGKLVKEKGPLEISTAVRVIAQALDGLAHAHKKGIVHRDVKPANLLLGKDQGKRVVKVADFGLARAYDTYSCSGLTLQGDLGGTPAFMAPEQVTHLRDAKPAADQYSAAASLYYLLTGKHALNFGMNFGDNLIQIVSEPRVPIQSRRADIPAPLADAIHKALSMEPEARYPDTTALRDAIRPFA